MKSKYTITNLMKKQKRTAKECIKLLVEHDIHKEKTGKSLLSEEEIQSIVNCEKDDVREYNRLVDVAMEIQFKCAEVYQHILSHHINLINMKEILESYFCAVHHQDVIGVVEYLEEKYEEFGKHSDILKSSLRYSLIMSSIYAYRDILWSWDGLEELKNIDIMRDKKAILNGLEVLKEKEKTILDYQTQIRECCDDLETDYYFDWVQARFEELQWLKDQISRFIKSLHRYFEFVGEEKGGGYDGFLWDEIFEIKKCI